MLLLLVLLPLSVCVSLRDADPITCETFATRVTVTRNVAAGSVKLISEGTATGVSAEPLTKVLVVQPHNGSLSADRADAAHALVQAFVAEREQLRAVQHPSVARLLGGCWDEMRPFQTALVVEYLETWTAVVDDDRLGLVQRLFIAGSAMNLVSLFDAFPVVGGNGTAATTSVVFVESGGRSFGVSGDYEVKLFALAGRLLFRQAMRPFGDDHKCASDNDCRKFFFSEDGGAFGAIRGGAPLDFDCNLSARRCWGLDSRTNVYTICRTLLRPLFGLSGTGKIAAALARDRVTFGNQVLADLQQLLWQCEANNPRDRLSAAALKRGFSALAKRLVGDDNGQYIPPFEPRNPSVQGYVSLQELGRGALTAGAVEAAERKANVSAAAAVHSPSGSHAPAAPAGREKQQKQKQQHLATDAEGTLDANGEWRPHAKFFSAPVLLTNWYFRLSFSETWSRNSSKPVVRLAGTVDEQAWLSTPVRLWMNSREIETANGKRYILGGAPDCQGLKSVGFADRMCALFRDGFPQNWLTILQPVWDQLNKAAEAETLLADRLLPPQLAFGRDDRDDSGQIRTPRPTPSNTRTPVFHCRGNKKKCELALRRWQKEHPTVEPMTTSPLPTPSPTPVEPPKVQTPCFQLRTCAECNAPLRRHKVDFPSDCAWCPSVASCVARSTVLQTCAAPLLDVSVCETAAPTAPPTAAPTPFPATTTTLPETQASTVTTTTTTTMMMMTTTMTATELATGAPTTSTMTDAPTTTTTKALTTTTPSTIATTTTTMAATTVRSPITTAAPAAIDAVEELQKLHALDAMIVGVRCGFSTPKGVMDKVTGACCPMECLVCDDDASCAMRSGGAEACCASNVKQANVPCTSHQPPPCSLAHLISAAQATPAPPPQCADGGIASTDGTGVCCASICGECASDEVCERRNGGRVMCCPATIRKLGVDCATSNTPPCVRKP
jgi:hypothetical protein